MSRGHTAPSFSLSPTFCLFLKSSANILQILLLATVSPSFSWIFFLPSMWLHQSLFPLCSFWLTLPSSRSLLPRFSPCLFLQDIVHISSFLSEHTVFFLSSHLHYPFSSAFSYLAHTHRLKSPRTCTEACVLAFVESELKRVAQLSALSFSCWKRITHTNLPHRLYAVNMNVNKIKMQP